MTNPAAALDASHAPSSDKATGILTWRRGATVAAGFSAVFALVVVVVATRHVAAADSSPLVPRGEWIDLFRIALVTGFATYVVAVVLVCRGEHGLRFLVLTATAIQALPLASPLLLSTDAYTYWAYGRLGAVHGVNPYTSAPSAFPHDPAYSVMGASWHHTTTLYGPLFTALSEGVAYLAPTANSAQFAFRVLAALSMVAIVLLMARSARPALAIVFVGWNPVFALHFAGGGHNDALMMAFAVGAIATATRASWWSAALWVAAISVKWIAVVFLILHALALAGSERTRLVLRVAVAGLGGVVLSTMLFGVGWLRAASGLSGQARRTGSFGAARWLADAGLHHRMILGSLTLALGLSFAYLAYLAVTRSRTNLSAAGTVFAALQGWLNPWYALWGGAMIGAEDAPFLAIPASIILSAIVLSDAIPR
jgi:hypothetical protein